jgi:hydroxylamine reductase
VESAHAGKIPAMLGAAAHFAPEADLAGLLAQAPVASVRAGVEKVGDDVIGLRALVLYGLKGVAAYAHHAEVLGETREEIYAGIAKTLDFLATDPSDIGALLDEALALGKLNYTVMEALDAANTGNFGTPVPTSVRTTPVAGKCVLVSGHDLGDLHALLEATKGQGINVYTHGEVLPAHAYPKLHEYPHLAGNYGGAWQNQQREFAAFPGPIVMTSNCLSQLSQPDFHHGAGGLAGAEASDPRGPGRGGAGGEGDARVFEQRTREADPHWLCARYRAGCGRDRGGGCEKRGGITTLTLLKMRLTTPLC